MTLDNLARIGKLKPHAAEKTEIARLLAAAERALADAQVEQLSADSRLDLAYRAMMQAALAAMLANGYRPATSEAGHHQLLIQALPKTAGIGADRACSTPTARRATRATTAGCRCRTRSRANAQPMREESWTTCGRGSRRTGPT
jgi:hypothetical protein